MFSPATAGFEPYNLLFTEASRDWSIDLTDQVRFCEEVGKTLALTYVSGSD